MARYARYDSAAPAPALVLGWYDTEAADYPVLPASSDLLVLSDEEWTGRLAGQWAVAGGSLVAFVPPEPVPLPWLVSKVTVVERLDAAGKLRAVRAALKLGLADALLSDAELLTRDRWDGAIHIASNDTDVRALLARVQVDANAILAQP